MSKKILLSAVCAALTMVSFVQAVDARDFRGGARTSVNMDARQGNRQANMSNRTASRQSANETNVATRQANRTTRQGDRQNTVSNVSNNRQNTINNVSNNRQNTINNYNNNYDHHDGWYDDHPVATAVAVTAAVGVTAAVVGSIVHSVPSNCSAVNVNGVTYQQCGSTWYQPQYAGTQVQYIVINPPR